MTVKEAYNFLCSRGLTVLMALVVAACCAVWLQLLPLPEPPSFFRGIVCPSANLWFADRLVSMGVNLACVAATALMMMALDRTFSLLQRQSTLDTTYFLAMSLSMPSLLLNFNTGSLLALTVLVCLLLLYTTYASPASTRRVFLIFLILSAMSMTQYCYLVYVLVFIVGVIQMRIFSGRTLVACLLGLVTPWWILGAVSLVEPVHVSFPDLSTFLTAFSFTSNLKLIVTVAFVALLLIIGWVGCIPQMLAYNAHRRAYNGVLSLISLMSLLAVFCDFANFMAYVPLLAVCASLHLGRIFSRGATKGGNIVATVIIVLFVLIFLCYPVRLMWL
ncbi:MAG: hypothetical protein ACI30N_01500 [Muribaculaceae bacterium]